MTCDHRVHTNYLHTSRSPTVYVCVCVHFLFNFFTTTLTDFFLYIYIYFTSSICSFGDNNTANHVPNIPAYCTCRHVTDKRFFVEKLKKKLITTFRILTGTVYYNLTRCNVDCFSENSNNAAKIFTLQ